MPASIPVPVRQTILHRWLKGDSVAKLAEELQLSERTVRHLVRRFAQRGEEALAPDYARCGTKKLPVESASFQKAVAMRQQHPRWGGGLIRVLLQEAAEPCPSVRTLQRWFQNGKLSPAPPNAGRCRNDSGSQSPHSPDTGTVRRPWPECGRTGSCARPGGAVGAWPGRIVPSMREPTARAVGVL